eukprot:9719884-Heterocapsa_arctica.AAC.1
MTNNKNSESHAGRHPHVVCSVGPATGRGSSNDGERMWNIAKLVHEQINNKRHVLLEANAVAD